ncbi:MAG: 1-acyl-sn-glycerol-3-phosphate acyltransferase [Anaerolineales bacterium]|nr:1-acyl-sn-glycerol-3-phosphate acyltransferase [Anaerolineales bacterium]
MALKIVRGLIRLIMRLISRIELVGMTNLPQAEGFVIAANHVGRLDAAMIYHVLDRDDVIVLVAEKYQKYAITRWLTKAVDGIFIDRFNPDVRALRMAMKRLQDGGLLAIAPEGTRSKSGSLLAAKPGGIYLAWKAGVPIVPIALVGTEDYEVRRRLKRFRRLDIRVVAGPAFSLPVEAKGKGRAALLQDYTDEVMCRIAALLPEEKRGFYADHPRLMEFL